MLAKRLIAFIPFWILLQLSCSAHAQNTIPTVGKDFWFGYMHNSGSTNKELRLFVTSPVATTGTVDIPLQGWSTNFSVVPNVTTTVIIPNNVGENLDTDIIDSKGIHVTTQDSVSLFAINFALFSADASKILPTKSLGTEYIVTGYTGVTGYNRSEFLIVASADNTEIEITPSTATQGGQPAGVPYLITLNQGESYQIRSIGTSSDLTGTRIVGTAQSGSCRPFAVFAGAQCANVPINCSTCDHLFDQLIPTETWGTEYYIVPFQTTGNFTYRIIARDNGTQVSIDGGAPITLNAGQVQEYNNVTAPGQIVATNPVQVMQFMQGDNCSSNGDPAMLILNANDQKIESVTFSTVASTVITNHYVNVIVESANIGSVLLDGAPIPPTSFSSFPTNPLNAYAQINIAQGSHSLYAANGFTAYVYGMGTAESYAYSVGSYKSEPLYVVDTTICTTDSVTLSPPVSLFSPEWTTVSDTSTVIGTSNNLTLWPPITSDIYVVEGNSLVSGCPVDYHFSISAPTTPVFTMSASEDTVCMFNSVQMDVNMQTPGTFEFDWWPSHAYNNPSDSSTVLTVSQSGWYGVTVSNAGSNGTCSIGSDSVYIHVSGGGIQSIEAYSSQSTLCLPDSTQLTSVVQEIVLLENFESGASPAFWESTAGGAPSSVCGSGSGDAMFFNGAPAREAETIDLDVANGGTLNFNIKIANGTAPCDDAELGEDVILEYSVNGGANWVIIATLFESAYPNVTNVNIPIPAGAQTANTRFRWSQPTFSAMNEDVWLLDDITITAQTSVSSLVYAWAPAASVSNPNSPSSWASPSSSGWITLQVGQGACAYFDSVYVDVNPAFSLSTTNDTTACSGQVLVLEAIPSAGTGYAHQWGPSTAIGSTNGNEATILPGIDTMIYVTVSSPLGCIQEDSIEVNSIHLDLTVSGDSLLCLGETGNLSATVNNNVGPYNFNWWENGVSTSTNLNMVIQPTVNTLFVAEVVDVASGCVWTDTVNTVVNSFDVNAGADTSLCGTIGYQLQGTTSAVAPTISWSNGMNLNNTSILNPTITANTTSTFILSVDDGQCTFEDTVVVQYIAPSPSVLPEDTIICEGTTVQLDLTGTSNVLWSPGVNVQDLGNGLFEFSPIMDQSYIVNYNSVTGCPITDTVNFEYQLQPLVTLPADITVCIGELAFINSSVNTPGGNYLWSSNQNTPTITTSATGVYTLTYSNFCGSDTDTIEIANYPDFTFDLGNDSLMCEGYSLILTPTIPVGGTITWSSGSNLPSYTAMSPSVTSAVVADANGCLKSDTIEIFSLPEIVIDLGADVAICEYDQVQLDGTSPQGVVYAWNTGDSTTTITTSDAGVYIIVVTDASGCMNSDTVEVTEIPIPSPDILGPDHFCSNETVMFEVGTGYAATNWSTGDTTNPISFEGITNEIIVQVTDMDGCIGFDTLIVDVVDVPTLDLGDDIVLCEEELTVLDATVAGANGYLWAPDGQTSSTVDVLPGTYSVQVAYQICTIEDEITISVAPYTFDLGPDQIICNDEDINLVHSLVNIDSIIWHNGLNSGWYLNLENTTSLIDTIEVSAMAFGCDVKYDTVQVILEDCNCQIFVPNTFTPNDDDINEQFQIQQVCPVDVFSFRIFNRWGELLFESQDPYFTWDGRSRNGEFVQDGTYTWVMNYSMEYTQGTQIKESRGHLNVLR